jgi:inhibitor of KinA
VTTHKVVWLGDSALRVEFDERIDPHVNEAVVALAATLVSAALPGVRDVVPTFRSVAVYFDPPRTDCDALIERLEHEAANVSPALARTSEPIAVPVCYDAEYGPDLPSVAAFAGVGPDEVIRLHSARTYRVFMLGFMPGFPYMGTVDARIAAPRLSTPRVRVPAGSVGIAGVQTGIYPAVTPGGWQIVGRTATRPFNAASPQPFLFKPGDLVQFVPVDRAAFLRMDAQ